MMLDKNPTVAVYIWKDVLGALIGNIVGGFLIGLSLYWMYLHNVSDGRVAMTIPLRG
jgi:formate/nitrite transporter FocA (FNT family)